jgi:hypothetical protein
MRMRYLREIHESLYMKLHDEKKTPILIQRFAILSRYRLRAGHPDSEVPMTEEERGLVQGDGRRQAETPRDLY